MSPDDLMDQVDAALQDLYPTLPPLSAAAKERIAASVDACPPMSSAQARRIGRLLRGSPNWYAMARPQNDNAGVPNDPQAP